MATQAEFDELYRRWADAVAARDGAALDELFDPDYHYTSPEGRRFERAEILALELLVPPPVLPFHRFSLQQVSPEVVIVRGGHGLRGDLGDAVSPELADRVAAGVDIAFTSVWRRTGDRWRVVSNDAHVVAAS